MTGRSIYSNTAVRVANVPEDRFEDVVEGPTPPTVTGRDLGGDVDLECRASRSAPTLGFGSVRKAILTGMTPHHVRGHSNIHKFGFAADLGFGRRYQGSLCETCS